MDTTKSNLLAEDGSRGEHPWKTHVDPPLILPIYIKEIRENKKVKSQLWTCSKFPDTILVTRGLKFDIPLLWPTDCPSNPQANFYNCGVNSSHQEQKVSAPFFTEHKPKFSTCSQEAK